MNLKQYEQANSILSEIEWIESRLNNLNNNSCFRNDYKIPEDMHNRHKKETIEALNYKLKDLKKEFEQL